MISRKFNAISDSNKKVLQFCFEMWAVPDRELSDPAHLSILVKIRLTCDIATCNIIAELHINEER